MRKPHVVGLVFLVIWGFTLAAPSSAEVTYTFVHADAGLVNGTKVVLLPIIDRTVEAAAKRGREKEEESVKYVAATRDAIKDRLAAKGIALVDLTSVEAAMRTLSIDPNDTESRTRENLARIASHLGAAYAMNLVILEADSRNRFNYFTGGKKIGRGTVEVKVADTKGESYLVNRTIHKSTMGGFGSAGVFGRAHKSFRHIAVVNAALEGLDEFFKVIGVPPTQVERKR